MRSLIMWLTVVLAFAGTAASAALPTRPEGPVYDGASIIPDAEEAALDAKLRAYNQATGRAVIVATVPKLDDLPVEEYAQQLAESWEIGGKETENGVLLLVAPSERKLRIHAARGVQERLTDAMSGRIIRDTIAPQFKAGNMGGGILAGVDAVTAQLDLDPADAKAIAEAAAAAERERGDQGFPIGSIIFWVILIVVFAGMFGGGRRRGARRSGINPGIVLWGVSEILRQSGNSGGGFGGGGFGGGGSGGGFGGFGGGGGGFDGGGASGDW